MTLEDLKGQIFIGVVEDNQDPKKLGRCKCRVLNIFDNIPIPDLPWATPWKDLNGNSFIVPDKGKIVSVVFDDGNIYKPEYIYAEHYNINLENKLKTLDGKNYTSMRALMFDHKTQIYSNDSEGLKLDYKLNNINVTSSEINLNLKDNFGHVNIGSPGSSQQAILGNHFLEWFDEFVDNLLGSNAGPYLGNLGAPVVANPAFISVLLKYKALKDPKFLSHHVNIVDNEYVEKQERPTNGQLGDKWKSTVVENDLIQSEQIDFNPTDGLSSDTPEGQLTSYVDDKGQQQNPAEAQSTPPIQASENPDVLRIVEAMQRKGYKILTRPYEANIVGIRKQYEGQKYSNSFKDDLYVFYKIQENSNWQVWKFKISTMPGFYYGQEVGDDFKIDVTGKSTFSIKQSKKMLSRGTPPNNGLGIMMEAQYLNIYQIGQHAGSPALKALGPHKFYRDNSPGDTIRYTGRGQGFTDMHVHKGFPGGAKVNNWSEGCQVFQSESQLNKLISLLQEHKNRYGNKFNYTLMLDRDI